MEGSLEKVRVRLEGDLEKLEAGDVLYASLVDALDSAPSADALLPIEHAMLERAVELEAQLAPALERVRRVVRREQWSPASEVGALFERVRSRRRRVGEQLTTYQAPVVPARSWLLDALRAAETRSLPEPPREVSAAAWVRLWPVFPLLVMAAVAYRAQAWPLDLWLMAASVLLGLVLGRRRWLGIHPQRRALVIWTGYSRAWRSRELPLEQGDSLELEDFNQPERDGCRLFLRRSSGSIVHLGELGRARQGEAGELLRQWSAELGCGARDHRRLLL